MWQTRHPLANRQFGEHVIQPPQWSGNGDTFNPVGGTLLPRPEPGKRHQHGNLLLVVLIGLPDVVAKETLFEPNAYKGVDSHSEGEDEVTDGHVRRRPEGHEETEVHGMANQGVDERLLERLICNCSVTEEEPRLSQSEEMEVILDYDGRERDYPAEATQHPHDDDANLVLDLPDVPFDGLPVQVEQDEYDIGAEHVGGAFHGRVHDVVKYLFPPRARLNCMLDAEQEEEPSIDEQRFVKGDRRV